MFVKNITKGNAMNRGLALLLSLLVVMGGCTIVDSPSLPVNLEPVTACFQVGPTSSTTWQADTTRININDAIDEAFKDNVKQIHLYNIYLRVTGPFPPGSVSGNVYYGFEGDPLRQLLHFDGEYGQFAKGISLLNPGTIVTYPGGEMERFVKRLNSATGIPGTLTVVASGNTVAPVQPGVCVQVTLLMQAVSEF